MRNPGPTCSDQPMSWKRYLNVDQVLYFLILIMNPFKNPPTQIQFQNIPGHPNISGKANSQITSVLVEVFAHLFLNLAIDNQVADFCQTFQVSQAAKSP